MKIRYIFFTVHVFVTVNLFSQQTPAGACEGTHPSSTSNSTIAWLRGGNLPVGSGSIDNRFGTCFNSPIFTITNSVFRTRLNGTVSYPINGFPAASRDGFFLIGPNGNVTGGSLYNTLDRGAFSLLHLNGSNPSTFVQEFGYRTWMRTGITLTENDDRSYIGYRTIAGEANDLVLNWSDNAAGGAGPDNMVFNFTSTNAAGIGVGNIPDLNGTDVDGREIMRLTAEDGEVGIGPRFSNAFQPQSTLHIHDENAVSSWLQISNQYNGAGGPTYAGPSVTSPNDGVRLGIIGDPAIPNDRNGAGLLYNQENRHLLFSTNAATATVNLTLGLTNERFRITNISAPTILFGGFTYGVYNPAAIANTNLTRSSLSHNPAIPVIRPMSLFHLGYGANVNPAGTLLDGWRPWMDIGTYTSAQFDNMYVGLKAESIGPFGATTYDAVINWGRNQDSLPNMGPDHLRFIFSTNYSGTTADTNEADEINALEVARFYPGRDTTGLDTLSKTTYGRFGVGDFTSAGLNQEPTHKLDVDGNGRFRLLPDSLYFADSTVTKVVMVDENGVLRWSDAVPSELGYACGDTTNITQLTSDRFIPFHDHNIYFEGDGVQGATPPTNAMALGYGCGSLLPAKFNVWQQDSTPVFVNTIAGSFINNDRVSGTVGITTIMAISARSEQLNASNGVNIGGNFMASRGVRNFAVKAVAKADPLSTESYAGHFLSVTPNNNKNFGIYTEAELGKINNYGIFAKSPTSFGTGGPNYAGYFDGDVVKTGADNFTSDSILKENIDTIANPMGIISQLKPKKFNYKQTDFPSMSLPGGLQYGLVAQEAKLVLPELVNNQTHPEKTDSLGTIIYPAINYLGFEYTQLIPIIIGAMKQQNDSIKALKNENDNLDSIVAALNNKNDEQDSVIDALRNDFNALMDCINSLNLCDSPSMVAPNNNSNNDNATNVELKDLQTLILDQNVPNPFAEMTTITYSLNDGVQKAQMLFYNATGKLINSLELQTTSGKGQLNVFANDLSNGIYTYTLVVDGKIVDTKRMVKNK